MTSNIKIIKYFIKNSPVGEVQDVLEDITGIIGQDFLQNPDLKQALREYYETHRQSVDMGNDRVVTISAHGKQEPLVRYQYVEVPQPMPEYEPQYDEEGNEIPQEIQQLEPIIQQEPTGEVEEFVYYDPVQKVKFYFHPITLEGKIEQEGDLENENLPANIIQMRDGLITILDQYIQRQFRKGTTRYAVFPDNNNDIIVEITCHNLNFKNFWGGEWLSTWKIDMNSQQVNGQIKLHNHYFEQGNIQFNLAKEISSSKVTNFTAKGIVDFIDKNETKYQEGLEEMYQEVSEKLLKGMRRIIPITRTKFDWNRPNLTM